MSILLGIDWGEKRTGVSISEELLKIATPYKVIECSHEEQLIKEIEKICNEKKIDKIVVGLPLSLRGEIGWKAKKVLEFVENLKKAVGDIVDTWDERLTTVQITNVLKESKRKDAFKKGNSDKLAATVILQSYLDSH